MKWPAVRRVESAASSDSPAAAFVALAAFVGLLANSFAVAQSSNSQLPVSSEPIQREKTGLSPGIPQRLARATWISTTPASKDAPVVYVFTDPQCPYCHELWQQLQGKGAARVQVRYLLVAFIRPESAAKAAAILQASDSGQAFAKHEDQFRRGGIAPAEAIRPETRNTLDINASLMEALGILATPALIYKSRDGEVHLVFGVPSSEGLAEILAEAQ